MFYAFGVVLLVIVVMVGLLVPFILKQNAKAREQMAAAWRPYAAQRGLQVTPAQGITKPQLLEGTLQNVHVSFRCVTHQSSNSQGMDTSRPETILTARSPRPVPVVASVYRTHALAGVGQALGFQDVQVGDPVFDPAFIVKADVEPAVRALLHDRARRALMAFPKPTRFEYRHGTLTCSWDGWETEPAVLDAALEVATALCA